MENNKKRTVVFVTVCSIMIAALLVFGTMWLGSSAKKDTGKAVRAVSLLYLDELAGQRKQVVENNLQGNINTIRVAINLLTKEDLGDKAHLEAYQSSMKELYKLDKFAFVDTQGIIYTSVGTQTNIDEYGFDYKTISQPEISLLNLNRPEKKVVIAVPVDIPFEDKTLCVCFMEIDMEVMLDGASMDSGSDGKTFCNIYTRDGIALNNTALGDISANDNLLTAMKDAEFESGYTYDSFLDEFQSGKDSEVSFTYKNIRKTLNFLPVKGTDWMITYLVRESVISDEIGYISNDIVGRSVVQSVIIVVAVFSMFVFILIQANKNVQLNLERKLAEAESKGKQEELEKQIDLQEKLLAEERYRKEQDSMITAMASDYRSVYYVDLDADDAVCYRSDPNDAGQTPEGIHFSFTDRFRYYAECRVDKEYREDFLRYIDPDNIRKSLAQENIIAFRYLARYGEHEYYEMLRMAGVRHPADRDDHIVHAVGVGFTIIDAEMRETLAKSQALAAALTAAESANKAKTAFLSNMSHEIRTPMNAIIGLDSLAMHDETLSDKTREYLKKINGSAKHLLGLINDILDMSRIESGKFILRKEKFSFDEMLEQINTMIMAQCEEKGLEFLCKAKGNTDEFYIGDDMKIKQVLVNILSNAIKFTDPPGSVTLSVEKTNDYKGYSTLRFLIKDTGIGISHEFLPHVFDAFAQENGTRKNKYGSTGLGLAITKNLVELMNGTITVNSKKDAGTEFTFVVTLKNCHDSQGDTHSATAKDSNTIATDEYSTETNTTNENKRSDLNGRHILLAEDFLINAEIVKELMALKGAEVNHAENGKIVVDMFKNSAPNYYDAILMDVRMPEMDGLEATKAIRALQREDAKTVPIIAMTANAFDEDVQRSLQAGMNAHLSKPVESEHLYKTLEEFIWKKENR